MTRKLIFLDVDGTLVNYENKLPTSAVEAIKLAQKNGHKIYIATGRSKSEMYDYILDIGFDGYIGVNGAYIEDGEEVIWHKTIEPKKAKEIVDWLQRRELEFYLECNSGLYASENFRERGQSTIEAYAAYKGKPSTEEISVDYIFPEMIYGANLYRDDVNKVSFILESYQDHIDSIEAFPDMKAGTWGGVGEKALFGDLGLAGIDKGTGIAKLLEYLGQSKKNTFAFGDAKVDIPMLSYCEIGVAMDNGGDEIKEMSDYITDSVEDNGLYNAFKYFGLI